MGQFDIHATTPGAAEAPYLVDVQSDLLADLSSRVVIPLLPSDSFGKPLQRLNPEFEIDGVRHVLSTGDMIGLRRSALGPVVASLSERREEVVRAIDFLLQGV